MKDIIQIKPVAVDADNSIENINLEEFDNEPEYYRVNIQPMLALGHEGELLNWLKTIGVLQQPQNCNSRLNGIVCDGIMTWVPAKIIDHYQLKCNKCSKKRSIRNKSIFQDTKCHFRDIIRLVAAWCKGTDEKTILDLLSISRQEVHKVYDIVTQIAGKYISSNISKWKLGHPQTVVLIDTYPEGLLKFEDHGNTSKCVTPILCIMEIQQIPQRYWLQVLDRYNIHNKQQIQSVNLAALEIIKEIVVPGSILVTNLEAQLCSYNMLQPLKYLYPIIVTVEGLKRHNTVLINIIDNLELIWKPAINTCHEAYKYTNMQMQNFIIGKLWKQQFQDDAFEMLFNEMCYNL